MELNRWDLCESLSSILSVQSPKGWRPPFLSSAASVHRTKSALLFVPVTQSALLFVPVTQSALLFDPVSSEQIQYPDRQTDAPVSCTNTSASLLHVVRGNNSLSHRRFMTPTSSELGPIWYLFPSSRFFSRILRKSRAISCSCFAEKCRLCAVFLFCRKIIRARKAG
jgi:hypothetical protein